MAPPAIAIDAASSGAGNRPKKKLKFSGKELTIFGLIAGGVLLVGCFVCIMPWFHFQAEEAKAKEIEVWGPIGSELRKIKNKCPENAPLVVRGKVVCLRYDHESGKRESNFARTTNKLPETMRASVDNADGQLTVIIVDVQRPQIATYQREKSQKEYKQHAELAEVWAFHWPGKTPVTRRSFASIPDSPETTKYASEIRDGDVTGDLVMWVTDAKSE